MMSRMSVLPVASDMTPIFDTDMLSRVAADDICDDFSVGRDRNVGDRGNLLSSRAGSDREPDRKAAFDRWCVTPAPDAEGGAGCGKRECADHDRITSTSERGPRAA